MNRSQFNRLESIEYSMLMDKLHTAALAQPKAVLFDAYGTLFDVYSVALLAEQLFPGHGQSLSVLWRDKQIEYTRLLTTSNHGAHYQPFWQVTEAALRYAIKSIAVRAVNTGTTSHFDTKNMATTITQLMNQYRHLSAFPENKEVLQALKAQGTPTGILSNGDPAMLDVAVKSAGLSDLLDHVISVDSIRKFKTHPRRIRPRLPSHRPAGQANFVCKQQRLGRAGRHMVWLPNAVG